MKTRSQSLCRTLMLFVVFGLTLTAAVAQDNNALVTPESARDPQSLAERYLGFSGDAPIPPVTPRYVVGTPMQFWVPKADSPTPVRVNAALAASTDNVYLWIEDGVQLQPNQDMTKIAQQIDQILPVLRQRDNYLETTIIRGVGVLSDPRDLLPLPDVDSDPHLYVLYTTNLNSDSAVMINPISSLPVAYAPYSNEHEMILLNTTPYPSTPLDDATYVGLILRGAFQMIMQTSNPSQAAWLSDSLNRLILLSLQQTQIDDQTVTAYLAAPDTPIIEPAAASTQVDGGQQLFLAYLRQRFSGDTFVDLFFEPGAGVTPLDAVLARHNLIDPVTGAPITARDAFADFVLANTLDLPFGDGRYMETVVQLPQGLTTSTLPLTLPTSQNNLSVNQFGAQIYRYTAQTAQSVALEFSGAATVDRLPMPDHDPTDRFYWSGDTTDTDSTLTRTVDLTDATNPTLIFDAWYDLAAGWNWGYVSVSSDDGATWSPLTTTTTTTSNPYGAAYGVGYTNISNDAQPHPFATMGVVINGADQSINSVATDSPAAAAGLLPGDVIVGYDHHPWEGTPDVLALLEHYLPGETVQLYIQRGDERLNVPVVLGASPSRIVEPKPLWRRESADLTPYAGQQILLRFERVSLPGHEDQGMAIDNVSIPEIGYSDGADGAADGWTLDGWEQIDNQVAQQWIVQAATGGSNTKTPHAQRLIMPGEAETSGKWRFALDAGETLLVTVSGANDDTQQRASFDLMLGN